MALAVKRITVHKTSSSAHGETPGYRAPITTEKVQTSSAVPCASLSRFLTGVWHDLVRRLLYLSCQRIDTSDTDVGP